MKRQNERCYRNYGKLCEKERLKYLQKKTEKGKVKLWDQKTAQKEVVAIK